MQLNEVKYGFKYLGSKQVNDIHCILHEFEHLKSGGHVYHLECDDTNCSFAIGFRTIPTDHTGVPHIIEHSVLCGSKKYPLKEPFVNLLKGSLATFLNAFTSSDWTMYPFASQTPKDFDNILSVYCDAVFNPLSIEDPKAFLQEGWHLELLDKDATPSYKGVVYNEMKGAMSSVDRVLYQAMNEAFFPDTTYQWNSGGEPDYIPDLTYQQYCDFYHKHYTPQNAMTVFYGKMDIEPKLEFLDREYFSHYEKTNEEITIDYQKPVINLDYAKEYEIGPDESTKDNTYIGLCYNLGETKNREEMLAMRILASTLFEDNDSVVKKALLNAKLGQDVNYQVDDDRIQGGLYISLVKTNANKKEEFKTTFENIIRDLVTNGINKDDLLATINLNDFKTKELDMGGMPKGIIFSMNMMGAFNSHSDFVNSLENSKYFDKFRKEIDNRYFENLLEKYILNSNHYVEVVVTPNKKLGDTKKKKMDALMTKIKKDMSAQEVEDLLKLNQDLASYQCHVDTKEELATLPTLELKDIPSSVNSLETKKTSIRGMKTIYHDIDTNGIAYVRIFFDISCLSKEELPYLKLMNGTFFDLRTKNYSAEELKRIAKSNLGDCSFAIASTSPDKDTCIPYEKISISALEHNIDKIPEIINEVLTSKFSKKEIYQSLNQSITMLKQVIMGNGMAFAMDYSASHFNKTAYFSSLLEGPTLLKNYNHILNDVPFKDLQAKMKEIVKKVFVRNNAIISISGNEEMRNKLKESLKTLKFKKVISEKALELSLESPCKDALVIPAGVSYNSLSNDLSKFGYTFSGKSIVLSHVIRLDYLWNEVRVKGGAYGTAIKLPRNGLAILGSYRDPNVVDTYQRFKDLSSYLKSFNCDKSEFKNYIIGATGGFDRPGSVRLLIDTWDDNYFNNVTKKDLMTLKKEALHTKKEDVVAFADIFSHLEEGASEYTIGNDKKIAEYNFDKVNNL